MSGFVYFLPDRNGRPADADLVAAGLAHLVPAGPCRQVTAGPGGAAGVVFAAAATDSRGVGFWPDRQTWRKVPGGPAWCGMFHHPELPPAPADLARPDALPGHTVRLADGRAWVVPLARALAEEDETLTAYQALPQTTTVDEDGRWQPGGLLPRFETLWAAALGWWGAKTAADVDTAPAGEGARATLDFDGLHDAALLALATNYRLGKAEVALLGLFSQPAVVDVLDALVDWPVLVRWLKKKQTARPSTPGPSRPPAGPPASAPDTGPRLPTSGSSPPDATAPRP